MHLHDGMQIADGSFICSFFVVAEKGVYYVNNNFLVPAIIIRGTGTKGSFLLTGCYGHEEVIHE